MYPSKRVDFVKIFNQRNIYGKVNILNVLILIFNFFKSTLYHCRQYSIKGYTISTRTIKIYTFPLLLLLLLLFYIRLKIYTHGTHKHAIVSKNRNTHSTRTRYTHNKNISVFHRVRSPFDYLEIIWGTSWSYMS